MDQAIKVMADAIDAVDMFYRFNDWTSDHVPGKPIEICRYIEHDEIEIVARYAGQREKDGEPYLEQHIKEARAKAAYSALIEAGFMVIAPPTAAEAGQGATPLTRSNRVEQSRYSDQ